MATVTSLGATREVTGSCHLLACDGTHILLDCGMHQGGDAVKRLENERFDFQPADMDAVVLSHAHLDHCGLLPLLVAQGFDGPIFCTPATRNLLAIMLDDAASIYLRDLEGLNKRHRRAGRREIAPRYTLDDVVKVLKQCQTVTFMQDAPLPGGMTLRFLDAGHILGSAFVTVTGPQDDPWRLVYSGDIGATDRVLMREPAIPAASDLVLMEGTYGNRDHRDIDDTVTELEGIIQQASRDGGNILIPAFAVGRTQELLFHLGCLYHRGLLNNWQVFLDSPMAIEVTRLYDQWLDAMDKEDVRVMRHFGAANLQQFLPCLSLTPNVEESMQINRMERGAIIIAGSGMCTGGRIRHHFKHRLWQERNHIVFAGFQAKGTLGRKLVDGEDRVSMFGHTFAVRAQVHTLGGFSAHAGRSELLNWAAAIAGSPHLRLVHGEEQALESLAAALEERGHKVSIAEHGEPFEINMVKQETE